MWYPRSIRLVHCISNIRFPLMPLLIYKNLRNEDKISVDLNQENKSGSLNLCRARLMHLSFLKRRSCDVKQLHVSCILKYRAGFSIVEYYLFIRSWMQTQNAFPCWDKIPLMLKKWDIVCGRRCIGVDCVDRCLQGKILFDLQ